MIRSVEPELHMLSLESANKTVVEALLNSPAAKEASARHQKAVADRRVLLAKDRAALESRAAADFCAHQDAMAKAIAKRLAAQEALRAATAEVGALDAARSAECHQFNLRMETIEGELRATADTAIAEFIASMREELERAMRAPIELETTTVRNPNTGKKSYVPGARRVRPSDRAQAIRDAIAAAEGLKLEPNQDAVSKALTALRDGLPKIGAELKDAAQ